MAPTTVSGSGWTIIKETVVFIVLDIIVVALRFIARKRTKADLGADDLFALLSVLFFMSNVAADYWSVFDGGVGWPLNEFTPQQLVVYYKADYISSFVNIVNVVCVRFCVLFLYRRIFTTQRFHRVTLGLGIFIFIHATVIIAAAAFRCLPVASIWDPSVHATSCINYADGFLWGMIINALIDAILLCLPFVMIRGLQMPNERKLALAGIFLLGAGTCIAAILRVALVYNANTADFDRTKLIIWSNAETGVGLICACLPTLRPIFPSAAVSSVKSWLSFRSSRFSKGSSGTFGSDPPHINEGDGFRPRSYSLEPLQSHVRAKDWLGNSVTVNSRSADSEGTLSKGIEAWEKGIRVDRDFGRV